MQQFIIGRLLAMPDGKHLAAMRVCHIIGHSAGSYAAWSCPRCWHVAFMQLLGTTRVTAVALPASRTWRGVFIGWARPATIMDTSMPRSSIMDFIRSRTCSMYQDLFLLLKKQRAPLRLMLWCTYSVPDDLRQTLYRLSTLCAKHTTTPALMLEEANRAGLQAQNEDQAKHLIRSLKAKSGRCPCPVGQIGSSVPMSRRLNRDPLPLHKPEAFTRVPVMTRPCLLKTFPSNDFTDLVNIIPIAKEDVMVSDLRGHTYCCGSKRGSFYR